MAKDAKSKTPEVKTSRKETAAAAPAAVGKEEIKQEEAKKTEPKKAAAKRTAGRPKKAAKEKEPMVPELFIQYNDDPAGAQEANVNDIVAKVKAAYVAEGHRESSIKSLKVYMKPQEWKAYYVINEKLEGQIQLF